MTMITPTSQIGGLQAAGQLSAADKAPSPHEMMIQEKFQDFVAGTFFKEMLKSLRKGQNKAAYFNGGQVEEMFQKQLDQQVSEDLAHSPSGRPFADGLYRTFREQHPGLVGMVPAGEVESAYRASDS